MPVTMLPPPPPDNRLAELDAILAEGRPDARHGKSGGWPRVPKPFEGTAEDLKARAQARAAHARECRMRIRQERKETALQHRREAAAHATEVRMERWNRQERELIRAALAFNPDGPTITEEQA